MENDLRQEDEYLNRKYIWHFEFPYWVKFNNLPSNVTLYPRYWWMTRSQMEWFYESFFKGHEDEDHFSTPVIKYSKPEEVLKCKSGIDGNIVRRSFLTEGAKRKEAYRYLKSGY